MGYFVVLLCCAVMLSLPGVHGQISANLSLKKAFGDLIIRLRKWMKDNQEELKHGMGAIREHISNWEMMGQGPKMTHRNTHGPSNTDRTSNNIQPKPAVPPRPVFKPKPSPPLRRQRPTTPIRRQQIPRWKPKNRRLSKSPYDPAYFLSHRRRIGRSVVPSQEFQRDYLSMQILSILAEIFTYAHSIDSTVKHPEKRKADLIEQKRRDLDKMSNDELKSLLKQLENMDGVSTSQESNKILVNGKEVDVKDIGSVCCPFG